MTSYKRVIGIDVSSKKLDVSDSTGKLPAVIPMSTLGEKYFMHKSQVCPVFEKGLRFSWSANG